MADNTATDYRDIPTYVYGQEAGSSSTRTVPFYFIGDSSESMKDVKIAQANAALRELVPVLEEREQELYAHFAVRLLRVGGIAAWAGDAATRPSAFRPPELHADGKTPLGAAFDLMAIEMAQLAARQSRARDLLTPAILLVSDGHPTDEYQAPLARLLATDAGRGSVRAAVAIGADCDRTMLVRFTGDPQLIFEVTDIYAVASAIQAATMHLSKAAVDPAASRPLNDGGQPQQAGASADPYTEFVTGFDR